MDWFLRNKEWLLSGAAVAIPIAIIGWLIASRGQSQKQKGGRGSKNIQVGGDFNVNIKNSRESQDE